MLTILLLTLFIMPLFPIPAAAEPDYSTVRVKLSIGDGSTKLYHQHEYYILREL